MKIYVIRNPNGSISFTVSTNLDAIELEVDQQEYTTLKKDLPFYILQDGKLIFNAAMADIYPFQNPEEKIQSLKKELEASDYKIIKCFEAHLMNESPPYDMQVLHGERERLREKIRALEVR